jgi:mono/diheme cytochrome c family protein/cytochrome c553
MTLRLGLLAVLLASGCRGQYIRPVSDEPIAATPERLQRGSYLVNQVTFCGACHAPDRDFMVPLMPFAYYQHLSDEDARSVVAYLRSVPPYRQERPRQERKLGFMQKMMFGMVGVQMHKPVANVPAPDRGNKIDYGRYLARIALCGDCHSLSDKGPRPETDPLAYAGSDVPFEDPALGKVYAANLTGDVETGLGRHDAAAIKQALRNGMRLDGKRLAPPMSTLIPHIAGMTDEDLDALIAYLKTVAPVKRRVPARELVEPLRSQLDR